MNVLKLYVFTSLVFLPIVQTKGVISDIRYQIMSGQSEPEFLSENVYPDKWH